LQYDKLDKLAADGKFDAGGMKAFIAGVQYIIVSGAK